MRAGRINDFFLAPVQGTPQQYGEHQKIDLKFLTIKQIISIPF